MAGLVIANNVPSLTAQFALNRSNNALAKSLERLSSGLKINRGADGPAALVISEIQRAQIAGLRTAINNTERGISVVQTAEGALNEINSLLIKVRSLALDSANTAVNDPATLAANQAEIDNALDTINRIANNTQFGNKKLLDGSASVEGTVAQPTNVTFLKATSDTTAGTVDIAVTTVGTRANTTATTSQTANLVGDEILTINGVSITLATGLSRAGVQARINEFTNQTGVIAEDVTAKTRLRTIAFGTVSQVDVISNTAAAATSTGIGTTAISVNGTNVVGTFDTVTVSGVGNVLTALSGASKGLSVSIAQDTAAAAEFKTFTGAQGNITIADNSLVFQIGPNQNQTAKVAVDKVNPISLGLAVAGNQFTSLNEIDVQSSAQANDSIAIIDAAITEITTLRGTLGAFQQNSLEAIANNLRATLENSVAAESVIRDTDFAEEIANFTKQQILVQAGVSVLSSANQSPQLILSLLGG